MGFPNTVSRGGTQWRFRPTGIRILSVLEPGDQKPQISVRGRLRLGNGGRERAVGVLKRAFEKGQLTREELDERTGRAYTAKIRDDLRPLLEDLEEYQLIRLNRRLWRYWLD